MKKAGSILTLSILFSLVASQKIDAITNNVRVESTGNSSSHVSIQNNVNSSNTNTSTGNTKIRIETNGEVKEYESSNGEDVHMESSDGSSKVTVKNNGTKSTSTITPKPTDGTDSQATKEAQQKVKEMQERMEKEQKNLIQKITDAIREFFANIF